MLGLIAVIRRLSENGAAGRSQSARSVTASRLPRADNRNHFRFAPHFGSSVCVRHFLIAAIDRRLERMSLNWLLGFARP